jgi:hypothetical protein
MTVMSDLIERGGIPEGCKVEIFDGTVITTPSEPGAGLDRLRSQGRREGGGHRT